jgi:hypothetical protein
MADVAANEELRFPCKNCGAKLAWTPGAESLTCGYCGYTEAVPKTKAEVVEHPFEDYKPDSTGWDTAMKAWECGQCGARTEREPHVTASTCVFCGSNQIQPLAETTALHKPESLLPFKVNKEQVVDLFKKWVKGLWFRPDALKHEARPDGVNGVYTPFWAYDTMTHSFWQAEAGYHYYETNDKGERVQRTRWEWTSGQHSQYFDDVLARGSESVPQSLAQAIEPFDTKGLVPYKPEFLAGMVAEDYRIDMPTAWTPAKSRIDHTIHDACRRKIPGDTNRNLTVQTSYLNRLYKLTLLPIWIASYRYQGKSYMYLVNGETGRVSGQAPFSWVKITLFVLSIAGIIGTIAALSK